jgi:hypothetical protein
LETFSSVESFLFVNLDGKTSAMDNTGVNKAFRLYSEEIKSESRGKGNKN